MKKRVLYAFVGLILLFAFLFNGNSELSAEDLSFYQKALGLEGRSSQRVFPQYRVSDYTLRYYDGDVDYVVRAGEIQREKPAIRSLAATIYEVDGEQQIVVPTAERMRKSMGLLAASRGLDPDPILDEDALQVSTIWHEGFHCYQFTNFSKEISEGLNMEEFKNIDKDELIRESIDANPNLVDNYVSAERILDQALKSNDPEETTFLGQEFLNIYHKRRQSMKERSQKFESLYETIEGTAQYVESRAYLDMAGETAYHDYYVGEEQGYIQGIGKYYQMGRKICLLLDKLDPDWSQEFDFSKSLDILLKEQLEPLSEE